MGSNRTTVNAVIDLQERSLWFGCDNYTSSTYVPIPCNSPKCEIANGNSCQGCNGPLRPGCTNNTCGGSPFSPYQGFALSGGLAEDTLYSKNHVEVANKLNLPDKFSLCLPSSGLGKLYIGGGSSSKSDVSKLLITTPLIINSVSTGPIFIQGVPSVEYFINVQSIRVHGEPLSVKSSYFTIGKDGYGGTKISTTNNFTTVYSSIYKPLTRAFIKAASDMKIKSVEAVAPFRACFSSSTISTTNTGPSVPIIELVLPGNDVSWKIYGANSMFPVSKNVMCLAFVDGGSSRRSSIFPSTSIIIGAYQLENNLLEFDLVSSQLHFSSSLLVQNKTCSRL
ncbi:Eukaryotic aspartyl protease family protein [Abeliophyllum distichum]|uniref:Eukaryotic aspartyl protease family protein n=1 Tax=Abeliophyllum distichum TaxID=126358 RepID=A0ABD1Q197_9LAMI